MNDSYLEQRTFVRIVELGSLRAVAEEQGTEASTISRRLGSLERRLATRLIARSRVRSKPTELGERYYQRVKVLLDEIDALESGLSAEHESPRGTLRIAAPAEFGERFVAPVVRTMLREWDDLCVSMTLGLRTVNLVEHGVDVAIRIGHLPDSSLRARQLGWLPRVAVASPEYVANHGMPASPDDLVDYHFVLYRENQLIADHLLTTDDGLREVQVKGRLSVNSLSAVRQAVRSGLGIHIGPTWAFCEDLEAGTLVEVLEDSPAPALPLHALWVAADHMPAKLRVFIDAMIETCHTIPTLHQQPSGSSGEASRQV